MNSKYKYKVCTLCYTYNHSAYIKETLDGFALQEVNFPVVFCVVDDASPDGEAEVIRDWCEVNLSMGDETAYKKQMSYGELVFAPSKMNNHSFFAILLLAENHNKKKDLKRSYLKEWEGNAEYRAICEGDDCWIHPHKLQMQVDFLETHPDYVMCHTDFALSNGQWRNHKMNLSENDIYFPQCLFGELRIGTLTALYRTEAFNRLPHLNLGKGWPMGDTPLWIEMAHEGKIKYIDTITAIYRVLSDSASHGSFEKEEEFAVVAVNIRRFYADYYGFDLPNNGYNSGFYTTMMKIALKHNRKDKAIEYFREAKQKGLLSKKTYIFYLATRYPLVGVVLRFIKRQKVFGVI